jgi:plastocyanin
MPRLLLLALLPLGLLAAPASGDVPQLVGTVGPGFTIDLADASGQHVDVVTAGRYELTVHDRSEIHNFVLGSKATGERFIDTGVEFVGDRTVTVDLVPGEYAYACSPHFEVMNGHLRVVPSVPTTTNAGGASPLVRLLSGPRELTLGQVWTATLQTVGRGTPVVTARLRSTSVRARATALAPHHFRVRVRLSAVGRWRVTASLAGRSFPLGSVNVHPAA